MADKTDFWKVAGAALVGALLASAGVAYFDSEPVVKVPTADEVAAAVVAKQGTQAGPDLNPILAKLDKIEKIVQASDEPFLEDAVEAVLKAELEEDDFREFLEDEGYVIDEDSEVKFDITKVDVDFADFHDGDFTGEAKAKVTFHDEEAGEDKTRTVEIEFAIDNSDLEDVEFSF